MAQIGRDSAVKLMQRPLQRIPSGADHRQMRRADQATSGTGFHHPAIARQTREIRIDDGRAQSLMQRACDRVHAQITGYRGRPDLMRIAPGYNTQGKPVGGYGFDFLNSARRNLTSVVKSSHDLFAAGAVNFECCQVGFTAQQRRCAGDKTLHLR